MTVHSGIVFLLLALAFPACAVDRNVAEFSDPILEQRYRLLLEELRCVVCQNQSLADSNAELAQDLRDEVREMLAQGKSDSEINTFLVQRYGDFVLYRPPFKSSTLLLWLGPALLLAIALPTMLFFIRRQKREADDRLTQADKDKLRNLLDEKDV